MKEPAAKAALDELHKQYRKAFDTYMALLDELPVWRTREQQERLNVAYTACDRAKWIYDKAKFEAERKRWAA